MTPPPIVGNPKPAMLPQPKEVVTREDGIEIVTYDPATALTSKQYMATCDRMKGRI